MIRIAVPYENGAIFQHFGHTQQFKVYDVENLEVVNSFTIGTEGSGHDALAGFLAAGEVDALLCGSIGGGAQTALRSAGIRLFAGVSGNADAAVSALLSGTLEYVESANCSHHHDSHEDGCHCGGQEDEGGCHCGCGEQQE